MLLQIKREIATLKVLKHPNIVRLHEVQYNPSFFFFFLSLFFSSLSLFLKIIFSWFYPETKNEKKKKILLYCTINLGGQI